MHRCSFRDSDAMPPATASAGSGQVKPAVSEIEIRERWWYIGAPPPPISTVTVTRLPAAPSSYFTSFFSLLYLYCIICCVSALNLIGVTVETRLSSFGYPSIYIIHSCIFIKTQQEASDIGIKTKALQWSGLLLRNMDMPCVASAPQPKSVNVMVYTFITISDGYYNTVASYTVRNMEKNLERKCPKGRSVMDRIPRQGGCVWCSHGGRMEQDYWRSPRLCWWFSLLPSTIN